MFHERLIALFFALGALLSAPASAATSVHGLLTVPATSTGYEYGSGDGTIVVDLSDFLPVCAAGESPPGAVWHRVPVPAPAPGRSVAFEVAGARLLLCNVDGAYHAIADECSHMKTPLAGGRLDGCLLECPLHGGKIDVRDGSPAAKPIRRPVASHPVRAADGALEVALPA